jgi:hypothetical protein
MRRVSRRKSTIGTYTSGCSHCIKQDPLHLSGEISEIFSEAYQDAEWHAAIRGRSISSGTIVG